MGRIALLRITVHTPRMCNFISEVKYSWECTVIHNSWEPPQLLLTLNPNLSPYKGSGTIPQAAEAHPARARQGSHPEVGPVGQEQGAQINGERPNPFGLTNVNVGHTLRDRFGIISGVRRTLQYSFEAVGNMFPTIKMLILRTTPTLTLPCQSCCR